MADVSNLIAYYANLLILQYNGLPKASATASLIAETILSDGLAEDVGNAYDVLTAVGPQLDVIGKYVGVDRYFAEIDLINYFALVPYSEYLSLPSSPPAWGCTTYAAFSDFNYNGTVQYKDYVTSQNELSDDVFRILIQLAIILDNSNYSHEQIDNAMFGLFGGDIRPESTGGMVMQYFITGAISTLIQAILTKKLLPKPMGVGLQIITNITGDMFALSDYSGVETPYGYGLATYANYATLPGEVLTYSQIAED